MTFNSHVYWDTLQQFVYICKCVRVFWEAHIPVFSKELYNIIETIQALTQSNVTFSLLL